MIWASGEFWNLLGSVMLIQGMPTRHTRWGCWSWERHTTSMWFGERFAFQLLWLHCIVLALWEWWASQACVTKGQASIMSSEKVRKRRGSISFHFLVVMKGLWGCRGQEKCIPRQTAHSMHSVSLLKYFPFRGFEAIPASSCFLQGVACFRASVSSQTGVQKLCMWFL